MEYTIFLYTHFKAKSFVNISEDKFSVSSDEDLSTAISSTMATNLDTEHLINEDVAVSVTETQRSFPVIGTIRDPRVISRSRFLEPIVFLLCFAFNFNRE